MYRAGCKVASGIKQYVLLAPNSTRPRWIENASYSKQERWYMLERRSSQLVATRVALMSQVYARDLGWIDRFYR